MTENEKALVEANKQGTWDKDEVFYRIIVTEFFMLNGKEYTFGGKGKSCQIREKKCDLKTPIKAVAGHLYKMAIDMCKHAFMASPNYFKVTLKSPYGGNIAETIVNAELDKTSFSMVLHDDLKIFFNENRKKYSRSNYEPAKYNVKNRLPREKEEEILNEYKNTTITRKNLAKKYRASYSYINDILGDTYRGKNNESKNRIN